MVGRSIWASLPHSQFWRGLVWSLRQPWSNCKSHEYNYVRRFLLETGNGTARYCAHGDSGGHVVVHRTKWWVSCILPSTCLWPYLSFSSQGYIRELKIAKRGQCNHGAWLTYYLQQSLYSTSIMHSWIGFGIFGSRETRRTAYTTMGGRLLVVRMSPLQMFCDWLVWIRTLQCKTLWTRKVGSCVTDMQGHNMKWWQINVEFSCIYIFTYIRNLASTAMCKLRRHTPLKAGSIVVKPYYQRIVQSRLLCSYLPIPRWYFRRIIKLYVRQSGRRPLSSRGSFRNLRGEVIRIPN